jgi:uncharacterized membrane protein YozB (DUF420 family)
MLDVVFLAMFAVVPVLLWSWYLVRVRRNFGLHKRVQIVVALVLLAAVSLFELDMRLHGWRDRADASPYMGDATHLGWVLPVLGVHLAIAVSTFFLWFYVIVGALRNFDRPPQPNAYSQHHRRFGRLAMIGMILTSVTGWIFYYLAFVA